MSNDREEPPTAAFGRSWSTRLVTALWMLSAVATIAVGVTIGTALTNYEGLVLTLTAATAPTSWLALALVLCPQRFARFRRRGVVPSGGPSRI